MYGSTKAAEDDDSGNTLRGFESAAIALGYLSVQSSPVRVRSCARPLSMRAAIRKPSSLISCHPLRPGRRLLDRLGKPQENEARKRRITARRAGLEGLRGRTLDDTHHATTLKGDRRLLRLGGRGRVAEPAETTDSRVASPARRSAMAKLGS